MQINSQPFFNSQLSGMTDLQTRIARLQQEISTGKKVLQPSDDPAGYIKVQGLKQSVAAFDQYDRNIGVATQRLSQEDTILSNVVTAGIRLKELALQGTNGTNDPAVRKTLATEMQQISDEMVTFGNSVDSNGDQLFAGYHSKGVPFTTDPAGVVHYGGDSGRREVEIAKGVTTPTSSSGQELFMQVSRPDGKPSASIFSMIKSAVDALNAGQPCPDAIGDMQAAIDHFNIYQTISGARQQKVNSVQQAGQSAILSAKTMQSSIEDAKIEDVATELSQKTLNLTASETSFSKIAQLSLFNYIK
jgi:flagellar hook-associated protein 3 FlgL